MKDLDVNGDGTCSFQEFTKFWSSRSGLGGYKSAALMCLKAKLKAGAMLDYGRKFLSATGAQDTNIDVHSEVVPTTQTDIEDKMSIKFEIQKVDQKAKDKPFACIKLRATDAGAATEVREKVTEVRKLFQFMGSDDSVGDNRKAH